MRHSIEGVKIYLNLLKLLLYFSHYLISSKFEGCDEVMAKEQHQFREIEVDFKTKKI